MSNARSDHDGSGHATTYVPWHSGGFMRWKAPLLFVAGLITLSIGLAIVLGHNIWSGGVLPVVITLFGWIQLIRGLIFLLAPPDALASLSEHMDFEKFLPIAAAIALILGFYLTFMGFRVSRP